MSRRRSKDEILRDMFVFATVGQEGSFSRAATTLGVSVSSLSRRITNFEEQLGVQLIKRTTRKLELTEPGSLYLEHCLRIVEQAQKANDDLQQFGGALQGHLRVTMPVDFGVVFVAPLLEKFMSDYPQISLECDVSPQRVDMILGQFDLALRLGALPDSALVAHPLVRLNSHIFAAPKYLARNGTPQHPSELAQHQCVRILGLRPTSTWRFRCGEQRVDVEVRGRLAMNNMGMLCRLAADGAGIALLADQIATEYIADGRLVRLLPLWSLPSFPVVAITTSSLLPAKTRVFVEFLREKLAPLEQGHA